jgi:hypothetical protein
MVEFVWKISTRALRLLCLPVRLCLQAGHTPGKGIISGASFHLRQIFSQSFQSLLAAFNRAEFFDDMIAFCCRRFLQGFRFLAKYQPGKSRTSTASIPAERIA